ncbi:MAG TPA: ComEC/Rec2 family competence protein, partial [Bryobacteraceae bacterium]|nr:ComEC/Rec2 family competence protein [Bryobacteraceae bacterium]
MRACILAFALGVWLLQQQAELPNVRWAWTLLPGGVFALLLSRCRANIFAITGKVLFAGVLLGMGFFWAAVFAQSRLADVLPHEWEGRDIQLIGVVAELPQVNEDSVRFAFEVERVLTEEAVVPARILLAWYKERGKQVTAVEAAPPLINAGERWRITARLRRPHGSVNPHGFDFEQWALERNLRATGYVREDGENMRLDEMVDSPAYQVERLRQEIRKRFIQALPDHAYTGVLVALAVGDQR